MNRAPIFDAIRGLLGRGFTTSEIRRLDNAIDAALTADALVEVSPSPGDVTEKIALELLEHEALVLEAYKDSVGVWTWSCGITDSSGHAVMRYKDNPQTVSHCLAVYIWLLRKVYLPDVLAAFGKIELTEEQLGAALSFHYNTGAIKSAEWVKSFCAGREVNARTEFMNWTKPKEIISRRKAERNLFFDGVWSHDGRVTAYDVRKPSYAPDWKSAHQVDIRDQLRIALKEVA